MQAVKRLKEHESDPFDLVLSLIRRGEIKPGRYSHLVKIDKDEDYSKKKELFKDGKS